MAVTIDGTANTVTPLNGALGATTPSTVVATTVTDSTGTLRPLVLGTQQATTSGNTVTFGSIPSWVKRITVMMNDISIVASQNISIQLGTASGLETTGYSGVITSIVGASAASNTMSGFSGFPITRNTGGANRYLGTYIFTNMSGNIWIGTLINAETDSTGMQYASGVKTTAAVLDRIAITCFAGTFDAGTINIMYE
jgi:hypothetical protein